MKKFWKKHRALVIVVIVAILIVLASVMRSMTLNGSDPHAGHDHSTDDHTTQTNSGSAGSHDGHDHSSYDVSKGYTETLNSNGTYTISVVSPHNEKIVICDGLKTKPSYAKLSNSVLMVGNTADPVVSDRWAVFCDGMNNKVSQRYTGCLATQGTTVVVGTNNGTTVEVKDAFTGTVHSKTNLPDASATDSRSIIQKAEWDKSGALIVTYWAGETVKTHTITMP